MSSYKKELFYSGEQDMSNFARYSQDKVEKKAEIYDAFMNIATGDLLLDLIGDGYEMTNEGNATGYGSRIEALILDSQDFLLRITITPQANGEIYVDGEILKIYESEYVYKRTQGCELVGLKHIYTNANDFISARKSQLLHKDDNTLKLKISSYVENEHRLNLNEGRVPEWVSIKLDNYLD